MHCYCYAEIVKNQNRNILSQKFTDVDPKDQTEYCREWMKAYILRQVIQPAQSLITIIINIIATMISEGLGAW